MTIERILLASGILLLALSVVGCGERSPAPASAATDAAKAQPGEAAGKAAGKDAGKGAPTVAARNAAGTATAVAAPAPDPQSIRLTPDLGELVKTGPIVVAEVGDILRIAGRLEVNGYKTARIGAPVTGRISDIKAVLGQEVRQGERLADINSQELTGAQLAFLKAHSAEQLTSRAVERADLLLKADVIGSAELQRRQSEQTVARAEKRAAADQLRVLGISSAAVDQLEANGKLIAAPITSTQAGTVIERKIAQGQVVQPSDVLFVVSDLRSIWAAADIPEQEAGSVRRDQRVEIEIPALGNQRRIGRIIYIADVVNPETRTVRVGVDLDNAGKLLKPAMLTTMLIEGRAAQRQVVPAAAVVRENNLDHIFAETAPGLMRLTRVNAGVEKNGMRALLDKLPPGRVVTQGAFHLNNERLKRNQDKKG